MKRKSTWFVLAFVFVLALAWQVFLPDFSPLKSNQAFARSSYRHDVDNIWTKAVEKAMPGVVQVQCKGSSGTGMILKVDGRYFVASNRHVVINESSSSQSCNVGGQVDLHLWTRDRMKGTVIYVDDKVDMCIIKPSQTTIEGKSLTSLETGDPYSLKIGQWVIAIGHPLGLLNSASTGIVSGMYRSAIEGTSSFYIQTDAAINPGNSGGPLVNLDAEVVGMNTSKLASEQIEGMAFAIPIDVVVARIPRGEKFFEPGMLGVLVEELDAGRARGLGVQPGALSVSRVVKGSAAEAAGLEPGDIIIRTEKGNVLSNAQFRHYLATKWAGDKADVVVYRRGREKPVNITLGRRQALDVSLSSLGMQCSGARNGVKVSSVSRNSPAAGSQLMAGYTILRVGADNRSMTRVTDPSKLERGFRSIARDQDYAILEVETSSGDRRYLRIEFDK